MTWRSVREMIVISVFSIELSGNNDMARIRSYVEVDIFSIISGCGE